MSRTISTKKKTTKTAIPSLEEILPTITESLYRSQTPLQIKDLALSCKVPQKKLVSFFNTEQATQDFILTGKSASSLVLLRSELSDLIRRSAALEVLCDRVRAKRVKGPLAKPPEKFSSDLGLPKVLQPDFNKLLLRFATEGNLPSNLSQLIIVARTTEQSIGMLLRVLESQRSASPESYPVGEARLIELADVQIKQKDKSKIFGDPKFLEMVAICCSIPGAVDKKPAYILRRDVEDPPANLLRRCFDLTMTASSLTKIGSRSKKKTTPLAASGRSAIFTPTTIAATLLVDPVDQELFRNGFRKALERTGISHEVGWIELNGERGYVRLQDFHPLSDGLHTKNQTPKERHTSPSSNYVESQKSRFAEDFRLAFDRLNRETNGRNQVLVSRLRSALSEYERSQFDHELRALRASGEFTMDSAQGGSVQLSEADRNAGIREGSSVLTYVAKKG